MKKYYDLKAVINGESHRFSKHFSSREAAVNYIFNYFDRKNGYSLQLEDEYEVENKHDKEYVFDYNNRFRITRVCC